MNPVGRRLEGRRAFFRVCLFIALAMVVVAGRKATAQECGVNWYQADPCHDPFGELGISDVAYDGQVFVGVGNGGFILTSSDGKSWVQRSSRTRVDLSHVVAGNGRFVAYGMAGARNTWAMLTSDNGESWIVHWNGMGTDATQFAGGLFFDFARTSPDGIRWTPFYLPSGWTEDFRVAYGNGRWLYLQGGDVGEGNYTSLDARTWQLLPHAPFIGVRGLIFGAGRFVVLASGVYSTVDGRSWKKAPIGAPVGPMAFGNGRFIVLDKGKTWFSANGKKWTSKTSDLSVEASPFKLFWTGAAWILFGRGSQGQVMAESADGQHWTAYPRCRSAERLGGQVRYFPGAGLFVAAGALAISADGKTWSAPLTPGTANGVAYGNGTFVGVGAQGTVLVSHDGRTWAPFSVGTAENLNDVAFGDGLFAAVGQTGRIFTSPDGEQWTVRPTFYYGNILSIAFARGKFLAVGGSSQALLSDDGVTWQTVDLGRPFVSYPGPTASFALGRFIVSAPDGLVTSEDGVNWTAVGDSRAQFVGPVVEREGRAYANAYSAGQLCSADLETWSQVAGNGPGDWTQWSSLATDGSVLVLSGYSNLLWGTPAPLVTSITPASVPADLPTLVAVEGVGLADVTDVRFGDRPARSFTVLSDRWVQAETPSLEPGQVAVAVDSSSQTGIVAGGDVLWAEAAPLVAGARPTLFGATDPYMYEVTIWGRGLQRATGLRVDDSFMGGFSSKTENWVSAFLLPQSAGHAGAELVFQDGSSIPIPGGFTFVETPVIHGVKVLSAPPRLKVTGANFTPDLVIDLNGYLFPVSKFKDPQTLLLSGDEFTKVFNPSGNYIVLRSCTGAVRSAEFAFTR